MIKKSIKIPTGMTCKTCTIPMVLHKEKHLKLEFSKITDYIYIGTNACCGTHFDERLRSMGITADISLEDKRLDTPRGVDVYLWLPTPDHCPPTVSQLQAGIATLKELVKSKVKIYVHCERGHGRAPTLIAAYLIKENGWTPKQAVSFITVRRPIAHLTPKQWAALGRIA